MSLSRARAGVQARFEAKSRARETALGRTRQAIRRSANAIRAVHRGELAAADRLLAEARELLDVAESVLAAHPDVCLLTHLTLPTILRV
jgi:translin